MKNPCATQLSLDLFFDTEVPSAASDSAGALSIANEISGAMKHAIENCGITREVIAERMGKLLGQTVSKHILDAYTSPAREAHHINLQRAIAFDAATGTHVLLELYANLPEGAYSSGAMRCWPNWGGRKCCATNSASKSSESKAKWRKRNERILYPAGAPDDAGRMELQNGNIPCYGRGDQGLRQGR